MKHFCDDVKHVIIAKDKTHAEVTEDLRKTVVHSVLWGKMPIINFDVMCPTMKDYDSNVFDQSFVFDAARFMNKESKEYMRLVKPGENYDKEKTQDKYEMDPDFGMGFMMTCTKESYLDDENVQNILNEIKH